MLVSANVSVCAQEMDPLVKSSRYADKSVWSYHGDKEPLPWNMFKPRDFGSSVIEFDGKGVRSPGKVPEPGVHPRIFFSPEDLPELRRRLKETRGGQEAWKNILAYSNALKLTYDENAEYAKPDWMKGSFGIHGRVPLYRIGGYSPKREDYFKIFASGGKPEKMYAKDPAVFFLGASTEAFRCLIDDDAEAARTLARATITVIKQEQARRAAEDKPMEPGQPPRPSTPRSAACSLGFIYDFIFNYLTPEQRDFIRKELVLLSAWQDNYGTFNNAEASRSNWATFSYWVFDLMAIEGEEGFNDLKFLGLYRGWRNFFTYSFFDSGAAFEAEGKLPLGFDAMVAFDRVGWKYGMEPLSRHPMVRAYYSKFAAHSALPSFDNGFVIFDILGSMGGGFTTPHDVAVAKNLYPDDAGVDLVYRTVVGEDYSRMPNSLHYHWNQVITQACFPASFDPANTPEKLKLPHTFFCGQRAMMMTRSSWDKDATMLTMHVRGASGGHPYPDRNGIMLAGQGRTWITIPGKDIGSWAMNTVTIDEAGQNASTPGRVVDYADEPLATFMTGDSKYCWDWVWSSTPNTKDGRLCNRDDVLNGNINTGAGWKLVEQCFNDFAWTKSDRAIYQRPIKFNPHWLARDGVLSPVMRQPNTPVLKSMRSAGLVRGPRPYVLVVDDIQRDAMPARYDWNLTLPADVVEVKRADGFGVAGDIILAGKNSLETDGSLKTGEPGFLIRMLDCKGQRLPGEIGLREKANILSIRAQSVAPDFKVLLHAFRMGDPLPATRWDSARHVVSVEFPEQKDQIAFNPGAAGKTHVTVNRGGKPLVKLTHEPQPFVDSESDALTDRVKRIPERLAALRKQGYHPAKQAGLVAGWAFDQTQDGTFKPWTGSVAAALPIPASDIRAVQGPGGRSATVLGKEGLKMPWDFAANHSAPFTIAFWVKTDSGRGALLASNAHMGMSFDLRFDSIRFNALKSWGEGGMNSAAMLSSWTHFAVTFDGETMRLYRNGMPLMEMPANGRKVAWGKELILGGGNDVSFADLCFYQNAMSPDEVENLYLWGKYLGK
jgi:hypothetical protein